VAGNEVDTKRISGKVDVVAGQIAFQDVRGYWAQPYIEALAAKNVMLGFPMAPLNPMNHTRSVRRHCQCLCTDAPTQHT